MQTRPWRPRRQTPRVRRGRVQRKNRTAISHRSEEDLYREHWREPGDPHVPIVYEAPARGLRHVVDEGDLRAMMKIIPGFGEMSAALRCIVLEGGDGLVAGWHGDGVIGLCPWHADDFAWCPIADAELIAEHRPILDRITVLTPDGGVRFDRRSVRDYVLMHVFLHELGHHVDWASTRRQRGHAGGEPFAENFANDLADRCWDAYRCAFGGDAGTSRFRALSGLRGRRTHAP